MVAFLGVVKLCGALGLGTPTSRIVAGFAYALSPRILTLLGPISVEAWPSALAPWVLVPLVLGARAGSPRRAALLSALAVAAAGGVNAAATFAVIPLGRPLAADARARAAASFADDLVAAVRRSWGRPGGWCPLLLLGRYSPPFLDYIETASVTTVPTTLFDALRGTSHWVPYVDPTWQAGNDLISTSYLALNSGVLLLFGVVGMTLRRNPHRQFLVLATFLGLLMVTAGHGGAARGLVRRRWSAMLSTVCWRRCATCTSSTPSSGCRSCSGSPTCSRSRATGQRTPRGAPMRGGRGPAA